MNCSCPSRNPYPVVIEDWTGASEAARTISIGSSSASDHAVSIEIGARSQLDQVYVEPRNGQKFPVGIGNPMPPGNWQGPFKLSTIRTRKNPPTAGVKTRLELVFLHGPGDPKHGRIADVGELAGLTPPGAYSTWLDIPCPGRDAISVALKANTTTLTYAFFGVLYGTVEKEVALYPSSGTTTLTAGNVVGRTFAGDRFDAIRVKANQTGGTADVSWEAEEDE